ncbi:MAG TPA: OFA family MFS transporter [Phycisphaerae bacterium]|nr:OFA family MFS transporter [Phycisphaerae bacterium]
MDTTSVSQAVRNRWLVVMGALVIQVSLGAVYIWSVFQTPLKGKFPEWSETQVTLPAQIVLACFAVAVIFGGRLQDRVGPRVVATLGGIVLGAGLILARFTDSFASSGALIWLIFSFSVLGGAGIGMAYVCPIAACVKWFPDKRGLIAGLAVAGFGAGAFFFAPLAKALIFGGAYELLGTKLFSVPAVGVFSTFMTLGIIFLVAIVLGAQLLSNPPAGFRPAGWNPPQPIGGGTASKADFTPGQMLKTPQFWLLWITYFAGCAAGLQVIMKASPVWQSFAISPLTPPIDAATFSSISAAGAMAVSILAIFNSLGRILWGKVSDNIGRKATLIIMFILCGLVMLILNRLQVYPGYLTGICAVGLCFGGYLALYPAMTADFYGTKHIGVNYGWVFTAFGAGGIFGPFLAAWLMRVTANVPYMTASAGGGTVEKMFEVGDYNLAFVAAGLMCLAAAVIMLVVRPPVVRHESTP